MVLALIVSLGLALGAAAASSQPAPSSLTLANRLTPRGSTDVTTGVSSGIFVGNLQNRWQDNAVGVKAKVDATKRAARADY